MRAALIALVLISFAGCTDSPLEGYELEASGIPDEVATNTTFTFRLVITGGPERWTDHIGGHFWDFETDDPTGDFSDQAGACIHVAGGGQLPEDHDIECSFSQPGTFYLRGHVRYEENGETYNLWTEPHMITATA